MADPLATDVHSMWAQIPLMATTIVKYSHHDDFVYEVRGIQYLHFRRLRGTIGKSGRLSTDLSPD